MIVWPEPEPLDEDDEDFVCPRCGGEIAEVADIDDPVERECIRCGYAPDWPHNWRSQP